MSLINPHDVYVYPTTWKQAGYEREAFANLGIELPPNYADDLSTKPKVQKAARDAYNKFAPLQTPQARREYVNFYAYLNTLADKHVMTVLDTLRRDRADGPDDHLADGRSRRGRPVAWDAREGLHRL